MAAPKVCPRCETAHYNFQKCSVRETQKENVSFRLTKPNLPEGWQPWHRDHLEEFERRGNLIVRRSGFVPLAHPGKVIEPREQND